MNLRQVLLAATTSSVIACGSLLALTGTAAADDIPSDGGVWTAVDAAGGVYWRDDHEQDTAIVWPGHGIYTGDQLILLCWKWGGPGPTGNHLWYQASNSSRNVDPSGSLEGGWVNDHYLSTPGTAINPEPQGPECFGG